MWHQAWTILCTSCTVAHMKKKGKPPTICFAVPFFPKYFPGGAEIQTYFIARHMVSRGWCVHFTSEDCGQPTARLQNEEGIWVHKVKPRRFFNPIRCWNFYRELLRTNADIYYQRGGTEYTFAAALAASSLGSKFVWAASMAPDCDGNKFRRFLREEGAWGVKRLILTPDAWIRDALISIGRRRADVVVVQDEDQRLRMREKLGRESVVIKTGHSIPHSHQEKSEPPLVLWVANAKQLKRPELFIELARACRDLQAKFLLVGGRPAPLYLARLTNLADNLDNLELRWAVPFEQTNELLSTARLLVNTSTSEGFPNTFVQAWLHGVPVVSLAADPGGILTRERIGVCSGSFGQMVEDVRRLTAGESLRKEMGARARTYAVREHNLADKLTQYTELFDSLYNERRMVQSA